MITQTISLIRAALTCLNLQKTENTASARQAEFDFKHAEEQFFAEPTVCERIHLNLSERDPARLLGLLESAFSQAQENLTIELVGPGFLLHDNALMLFEEMRNRPSHIKLHVRARTCLVDGAILLWLTGDTRSMRNDGWIQLSAMPSRPALREDGKNERAILIEDEEPALTDLRTVFSHIDEWLPVHEIAGLRLFEADLREFGLLDDATSAAQLAAYFSQEIISPVEPSPDHLPRGAK